jgi:hypothetical protein
MFSHVSVQYGDPQKVLIVPERALFLKSDGSYLYRAKDGKAELTKVTLGERRVGEVEVVAGIEAGDDIITDGQIKLQPGAPVMLLSKPNLAPGEAQAPPPAPKEEPKPEEKKEEVTPPAAAPVPAAPAPEQKTEEKPVVVPGAAAPKDENKEAPPAAFVPAAPATDQPAAKPDEKKE